MQQGKLKSPLARKKGAGDYGRFMRWGIFCILLLVVIVSGVLALVAGVGLATVATGILGLAVAVTGIIQIYPVLFPNAAKPDPSPSPIDKPLSPADGAGQAAIFSFNLPLREPHEFYGRLAERTTLLSRIANGGSSSIVGERRAGKTWLLDYARLVAPTHSVPGLTYRVGYVSATHPQCKSVVGFVERAMDELKILPHTIDRSQTPLGQLSQGVRDLKKNSFLPVLCIDEFEGFNNREVFNAEFVEGLRALAQDDGLVLVTASKRSLRECIEKLTGETSPFFNIVQHIPLHPFTEKEASAFVEDKGELAGFDEKERAFFLRSGALYTSSGEMFWPPLRLQLVGQLLSADKQAGLSLNEPNYEHDFRRRLDEAYQAVMR